MFETERLLVRPLSADELRLLAKSPDEFTRELGFSPSESLSATETREAILNDLLPNVANSEDPNFYTMWIIVAKSEKAIVGGVCFHGAPNSDGEVEIGYGIDEKYQNRGFMTEAVDGMVQWLKSCPKVRVVTAETELSNAPSLKVLQKAGFAKVCAKDGNWLLRFNLC